MRDGGEEVAAEIVDLQPAVHREPDERGDEGDAAGPGAGRGQAFRFASRMYSGRSTTRSRSSPVQPV